MDINPYESPREPSAPPSAADAHSSLAGMTARFIVNTPEPHEVEVYCSRWTGLEIYRIDGAERLRTHSFGLSATRQFDLGEPKQHVLEITVKSVPWWLGTASLDGVLVVGELFPSERARGTTLFVIVVTLMLGAVVITLAAAGWLIWRAMNYLEAF